MIKLTIDDLHFVVSRLPSDVFDLIKKRGLMLAGGFIRETICGNKPSDIDIFGKNIDLLEDSARELEEKRKARKLKTKNAITLLSPPRMPVQFIKRWLFEDPVLCCNSFDFTVCQAAIWFHDEKWHSCISDKFYIDLAAKRLVYTEPDRNEDAGGSMQRVIKFVKRGYNIQPKSLSLVINRLISKIDFENIPPKLEASDIICSFLREVDPLNVIDGIDLFDEHDKKTKFEKAIKDNINRNKENTNERNNIK